MDACLFFLTQHLGEEVVNDSLYRKGISAQEGLSPNPPIIKLQSLHLSLFASEEKLCSFKNKATVNRKPHSSLHVYHLDWGKGLCLETQAQCGAW